MAHQGLQELIPQIFSPIVVEQFETPEVFAKVANTALSDKINKMGDTVTIEIEPDITVADWTGGDLSAPEKVKAATTDIKITEGRSVHFKIPEADELTVFDNPKRAKGYASRTMENFKLEVEDMYAALYSRAGIIISEGTLTSRTPVSIDSSNALNLLVECGRRIKKANISKNSKLFFIADPSFYANIQIDGRNFYTESGLKAVNGFLTNRFGFNLYESNRCASVAGTDYIYFGVEKECLGGAIKKNIKLIGYTPELSTDNAFKGTGMFGGGVYDSRKFGVAQVVYSSVLPNLVA